MLFMLLLGQSPVFAGFSFSNRNLLFRPHNRKISCKAGKLNTEPRKFVIQEHATADSVHWDLMLESDNCLQTWRLDKNPAEVASHSIEAVKIFDHPLKFLTYEGEITHQTDDQIEINLPGRILKGKFTLTHIKNDQWQFSSN